ncbi:MAG: hypothetical protein HC921_10530 [Synechococcaceae cyanobacterium SM2_3_1]|nr:hypothetical protein [Synechococcaceae cyanobacterium SM2_3_1]
MQWISWLRLRIRLSWPWRWGLMILAALGVAYTPLLRWNYPYAHSIGSNFLWAYQYGTQVLAGQWLPRWLEQSFASMGSPTFVFYPPLSMVAVIPFAALGLSISQQLIGSIGLALVLMAAGAWLYARHLFPQRRCCWLVGLCPALVLLSPYWLINILIRGALGEMWAMVWIPWLLWSGSLPPAAAVGVGSLAIGLIGLSHLPTILLLSGFWILLPWTLALGSGGSIRRLCSWLLRCYPPLILGWGLAASSLFPAVWDQDRVNIHYLEHALPVQRFLISGFFDFHLHLSEHEFDQQLLLPFSLMAATALIAWGYTWLFPCLRDPQTLLLLVGTGLSLVMMTDLSRDIYFLVPPLMRVQFSWRWMALTAVFWPFLWGRLLQALTYTRLVPLRSRLRWLDLGLTLAMVLGTTLPIWQHMIIWPEKPQQLDQFLLSRPPFPQEVDLQAQPLKTVDFGMLRNSKGQSLLTDVSEYVPRTAPDVPHLPDRNYDLVEWLRGQGVVEIQAWKYGERHLQIDSPEGGMVVLRMHAWPGWWVQVNDQGHRGSEHDPLGRLQVNVPPGQSQIRVTYRGTAAEQWGYLVTALSGLSLALGFRLLTRSCGAGKRIADMIRSSQSLLR